MNQIKTVKKENRIPFKDIKHIDSNGNEFWYERELQKILEYKQWRNYNCDFQGKRSLCNSRGTIIHDFADVSKIVEAGAAFKKIEDNEFMKKRFKNERVTLFLSTWQSFYVVPLDYPPGLSETKSHPNADLANQWRCTLWI